MHWIRALPLACLTGLVACTAEPNGPPVVLVTVAGLPATVAALGGPEGTAPTAQGIEVGSLAGFLAGAERHAIAAPEGWPLHPPYWLACGFLGRAPELPEGAPGQVILAANEVTLAEAEAAFGLETASFVTDHAFDEDFGFQQGFFQAHDMGLVEVLAQDGWIETAVEGARAFVAEKLPRPMEDAPFVWLHLDLRLVPAESDRALVLADALDRLGAELARRPDSLLALWALPNNRDEASWIGLRGPNCPPGAGPAWSPESVRDGLLEACGQRLDGAVVRRKENQ